MGVVLLTRSMGFGGAERQVVEIAKGLRDRGHSVTVVVFYSGGALLDELTEAGIPVASLEKKGRWDVAGFMIRLFRVIRRAKPQVVYSFLVIPGILAVLLKLRSRVRVIWGILASDMDLSHYDWFARFTFRLSCWFSRFADLILVNSETGVRFHQRHGFPPSRMVALPSGVDVARFVPDREAGRPLRRKWGVSTEEQLLGVVGRLDPMKDHPTLFKALAILREAGLSPRVVCIGEGQSAYVQGLQDLTQRLGVAGQVIWAGTYRNMVEVYNALDMLCLPSAFGEGWPNVLGEAMACGVPCIATDVGDSRKIVADCGLVVPPQDPVRLAEGLRSMLTRTRTSELSRARIVEHFSRDRIIQETERLLKVAIA